MERPFVYVDGSLSAGSIRLADLARTYGTPLYVYHRPAIKAGIEAIRSAFSPVPTTLCYSVKANPVLSLLRWLAEHDLRFDVVSGGELRRLLHVNVPADRIMVETDAPFLTPEPHRKIWPNEPKFVVHTARCLADLRGADPVAFEAQLDANAERFFGIMLPQ